MHITGDSNAQAETRVAFQLHLDRVDLPVEPVGAAERRQRLQEYSRQMDTIAA